MGKAWFSRLKSYRDCVIHARHINPATGVGVKVDRQAHVYDVLLNEEALNAAYDQLVVLRKEFDEAVVLIGSAQILKVLAADDPKKESLVSKVEDRLLRFRCCRSERLALPPMPEFPSESELLAAGFLVNRAHTATAMGWFQQWPEPLKRPVPNRILLQEPSWVPLPPLSQKEEKDK
jgi:hypothetical protein